MAIHTLLRAAYILNILILLPVCYSLFFGDNRKGLKVFDATVPDIKALSLLVASIWAAILFCSLLGLFYPGYFWSILLLQVAYKTIYLLSFVFPCYRSGEKKLIPVGITISFLFIIATYPFIIGAFLIRQ